jgi:hypothetical protein
MGIYVLLAALNDILPRKFEREQIVGQARTRPTWPGSKSYIHGLDGRRVGDLRRDGRQGGHCFPCLDRGEAGLASCRGVGRREGERHGRCLACRDHYREVYHTPETPTGSDLEMLDRVRSALGPLIRAEGPAEKSWYKVGEPDIPIIGDNPGRAVMPLSQYSTVVGNLKPIRKVMLFSRPEDAAEARNRVRQLTERVP